MSSILRLLSERDERIDPRVFSELSVDPSSHEAIEMPRVPARHEGPEASSQPWCGSWPGSLRSFGTVIE